MMNRLLVYRRGRNHERARGTSVIKNLFVMKNDTARCMLGDKRTVQRH